MKISPDDLGRVAKRLRALGAAGRRARQEDDCVHVEGGRGKNVIPYVRFRRLDTDRWVVEELGGRGPRLSWVKCSGATSLEKLLARWDDPRQLWRDLRVEPADDAEDEAEAAGPRRPGPKERAEMRAELSRALREHDDWLVRILRTRLSYRPPIRLRRIQLEWDVMSIHSGLSLSGRATDAGGDDASEIAPELPSRRLWPRSLGNRIGATEDRGWYDAAVECVEKWIIDCYRRAKPTTPCPVYLSVHEGMGRGINLATGRRTSFRE